MNSFEQLQALNVAICEATGAGKGHATTREAIARYRAMLVERAPELRKAICAARADTRRSAYGACRHHYIDGIASALTRAVADHARGELI